MTGKRAGLRYRDKSKTHLRRGDGRTKCGRPISRVKRLTNDPGQATCKRCLAEHERRVEG